MGCKGEVVFQGDYDPDVWDDSALIRAYDRAMASSKRELARRKNECSGKKRQWEIGMACRALYCVDGEEYEGFIVAVNAPNRSATVRFLGYNNEEEVETRNIMESLGQEARDDQLEQAEEDMEKEEEEKGDNWATGDWCRAVYNEDGVVYEGVIESCTTKKATVRFLGYNNREKIPLESLFKSKGEESRLKQENQALLDEGVNQDLVDKELQEMIVKNCPDIMATFGSLPDSQVTGSLPNSEITFHDLDNADSTDDKGDKRKEKKKKEKKEKKDKKKKKDKNKFSDVPSNSQAPMPGMPHFPNPHTQSPCFPSMSPGFPPMPGGFPSMPGGFPSIPRGFAPPPLSMFPAGSEHVLSNTEVLNSMLMSWYMAGFHTGQFQALSKVKPRKSKKDKDTES